AIEAAHQLLAAAELSAPAHGTTVTVSRLTSGDTANTVPDRGQFTIDVRASSIAELARVDHAIRDFAPRLDGAQIAVSGGIDRPPLERGASQRLFDLAVSLGTAIGY